MPHTNYIVTSQRRNMPERIHTGRIYADQGRAQADLARFAAEPDMEVSSIIPLPHTGTSRPKPSSHPLARRAQLRPDTAVWLISPDTNRIGYALWDSHTGELRTFGFTGYKH